jgi:hypothetical protein
MVLNNYLLPYLFFFAVLEDEFLVKPTKKLQNQNLFPFVFQNFNHIIIATLALNYHSLLKFKTSYFESNNSVLFNLQIQKIKFLRINVAINTPAIFKVIQTPKIEISSAT